MDLPDDSNSVATANSATSKLSRKKKVSRIDRISNKLYSKAKNLTLEEKEINSTKQKVANLKRHRRL
jgi:hypothetical protein